MRPCRMSPTTPTGRAGCTPSRRAWSVFFSHAGTHFPASALSHVRQADVVGPRYRARESALCVHLPAWHVDGHFRHDHVRQPVARLHGDRGRADAPHVHVFHRRVRLSPRNHGRGLLRPSVRRRFAPLYAASPAVSRPPFEYFYRLLLVSTRALEVPPGSHPFPSIRVQACRDVPRLLGLLDARHARLLPPASPVRTLLAPSVMSHRAAFLGGLPWRS